MVNVSARSRGLVRFSTLLFLLISIAQSQTVSPDQYGALRWRSIGPFRAGRVSAVAGVPTEKNVYYIGTPGGGVWKTTDAGQTWSPIFDSEHVASIGAVAVADSNPNLVFVGTGEQTQGDGVYKSTDAGKTWTNIGLQQTHIITGLIVDPMDPNIITVGAQGDVKSGDQRGIFRTTDGGKDWQRVFYKDEHTAVMNVEVAPDDPKVLYATTWTRRLGPPSPGTAKESQQDAGIYKSTDEGATWTEVGTKGLPAESWGRTGIAVAPGSHGNTVFAIVTQGLFKSQDGGSSWVQITDDPRILGSFYFSRVFVDPKNPQIVYVAQTTMYRSLDGGKTFDGFYGAPSGDDIHLIWVNPLDPRNMILGVDQGAIVSVTGGDTWSSWYNQPTGQFYHVTTDDKFPYYVYAAQQDSGTAAVASRSDYGEITYRDWEPTGGFEFSFIAPDPLNANHVYIGGWYGSVLRFDRVTGQIVHVLVRSGKYRTAGMAPIAFSPQDPHALYAGANYLLKTIDGGVNWTEASPDLTVKPQPSNATASASGQKSAVITTIALSTLKNGEIWAGTSNGLIHLTRDGKTWTNVTPHGLPERSSIEAIEASDLDPGTAYATVIAQQDLRPYGFRTHDFGATWQPISAGLPDNAVMRVVRNDPERKGLLYGGTETGAWVSFDDGDHWGSLQLNLPTTPVRDIVVHGTDVAIATYGRSLWILDDISPLRHADNRGTETARLLRPSKAVRTRWDMNQDTPLPTETPAGKNPPDGAILDYILPSAASGELKLSVYDSHNELVRGFSSTPEKIDPTPPNVPSYWFANPAVLTKNAGHNRFVWDLRYPTPKALHYSYYGNEVEYIEYTLPEHAIPGETPREQPQGPFVVPGQYTIVLNVNGKEYRQPLTITLDPRVHVSQADLQQQLDTERNISAQMAATYSSYQYLKTLNSAVAERQKSLANDKAASDQLEEFRKQVGNLAEGSPSELGLGPLNRELARLATMIESGDSRPAAALQSSVDQSCQQLAKRLAQSKELQSGVLSVNAMLQKKSQAPLPIAAAIPAAPTCVR
jgi:photosystem II stability/assembly factor-like uncharacterized protein